MEHGQPFNNQNQLHRRVGRILLRLTDVDPQTLAVGFGAAILGGIALPALLSGGKSIPPETATDTPTIEMITQALNLRSPLPFVPTPAESHVSSTTGDPYSYSPAAQFSQYFIGN
jgi:hypothetical protein